MIHCCPPPWEVVREGWIRWVREGWVRWVREGWVRVMRKGEGWVGV